MSEVVEFIIGAPTTCSDGPCGEILRFVLDPHSRSLSHLVVEPRHKRGTGRLVPIDLVSVLNGEIRLMCTNQEFLRLSYAEETVLLPSSGDMPEETEGRLLSQVQFGTGDLLGSFIPPVVYDTFPLGDVEVRPGERATATDGSAGTVLGVVVDSKNHRLISVLLREGHLWSRKDVDIPVRDVAKVDTAMHLNISKDEVRLLPEVNLSDPA